MELRKEILAYLQELKVMQTASMNELKPLIAIDGESFIAGLLEDDFYSQLLGGCNFTLRTHLSYHIQKLKERGIMAVFLFSGVSQRTETLIISKKYKKSKNLWEEISKNNTLNIEKLLIKQDVMVVENFREILGIVKSEGGEVVRCPGHSGFQLAHLERILGGILGGPGLACFGVNKIVTELEYETGTYTYFLVSDMLKALELNLKKFTEALVCKGFWDGKKSSKLSIVEILQQLRVKETRTLMNDKEFERVIAACNAIESQIYLCKDSEKLHIKNNANLLTSKNSDHLYHAMCLLPLSSDLISAFLKKVEVMRPPIADSLKYRTLVHKYKPLMRRMYSILNRNFEDPIPNALKGIKVYYWYDELQPFQIDFEIVKELNWSEVVAKFEEDCTDKANTSLQSSITYYLSEVKSFKPLVVPATFPDPKPYPKLSIPGLRFKVHLRLLEIFGLVTAQGSPTLFSKILSLCKPAFQNEMFIALELIKLGLLDWKPMNSIYLPETVLKKISPDSSDLIRFISRVTSLIPPTLSSDLWTSNVDHDLAQFYSMVRFISNTYQNLAEVFVLEEFIAGRGEINREVVLNAVDVAFGVPLRNVAVGILVKKALAGQDLGEIKKEVPQAIDVEGDLERAWYFWKEFNNVVRVITAENDNVRLIIKDASRLFKTTLITAGVHVI